MIRTVLTPQHTHIELDIPADYVGKAIEITCLSLDELTTQQSKQTMGNFWGVLSAETSSDIHKQIEQSKEEWNKSFY